MAIGAIMGALSIHQDTVIELTGGSGSSSSSSGGSGGAEAS